MYSDPTDHIIPQIMAQEQAMAASASSSCLDKLFTSPKFNDVNFILHNKKIPAHKGVLATCSAVFEAMFSNDMMEKESNEVKIDDVDEVVFVEMLRFIYTGKVQNPNVLAADLLSVADKYDLEHLKKFSQLEMIKDLCVEQAAKYLVLADLHTADLLKKKTIEFISRNAAAVIKTEGWKQLVKSYAHLAAEIFENLIQ